MMQKNFTHESPVVHWSGAVTLFFATLLLIAMTAKDYGVSWDEPAYFHASDLHVRWIRTLMSDLANGNLGPALTDPAINSAWHWNPYNVPHPPFSRVVSGWTKFLFAGWVDTFAAYRLGPAFFFAVLVAVMYLWLNEVFGRSAAVFTAIALIVLPNLFGFAHLAVTDLPLASLWFLTAFCFWKGIKNWKWSVAAGIVWGLALATKFPALLMPVPLILWAHVFHRDRYANNIFSLLFLGPLVMIAVQPYLWHQPGPRLVEFLYEGLTRGYRPETSFSIYFLDRIYSTDQLPWYYPYFIVGATTPVPMLALALGGALAIPLLQAQRSTAILFCFNWLFIVSSGLLPGAVLHDGVRQLLSALPFVVATAGCGFFMLCEFVKKCSAGVKALQPIRHAHAKIVGALIVLLLFAPALDTYLSHPYQLSYYNRLVGGIRGAYERGLETTYFMEAFTPAFLAALNEKLPQDATINASFANFLFAYYQHHGKLRPDIKITDSGSADYLILLNRRSVLRPNERLLMNGRYEALHSVRVAGVPLAAAFEVKKTSKIHRDAISKNNERAKKEPKKLE